MSAGAHKNVMTFLTGYEELWNGNSRTFLSSTFMSKGDGLAVINEARSSTLRFRRASNAVVRQAIHGRDALVVVTNISRVRRKVAKRFKVRYLSRSQTFISCQLRVGGGR